MRLTTMQENGNTRDRDMRYHHCKNENLPGTCSGESICEKIGGCFNKSAQNNICSVVNCSSSATKTTTTFVHLQVFYAFFNWGSKTLPEALFIVMTR